MARIEAAVRSPIAFQRHLARFPDAFTSRPETVGIKFEERLFVWHAFPRGTDPITDQPIEYGPSVTVTVEGEEDEQEAADSRERFLTALAYYYNHEAAVVAYGGSGESDPYWPASTRAKATHLGWMVTQPYDVMGIRPEPLLRVALAYYREGLSATSPFYRFLSFWHAIDAAFGGDREQHDNFINTESPRFREACWDSRLPFPAVPARALYQDSRNAIAHAVRDCGKQTIDPDRATDRRRLSVEATLLEHLARAGIERMYPSPVWAADYPETIDARLGEAS